MQAKSQERGLQLPAAILLPSCQSFCQFMTDLRAGSSFSVQIAVIWAIEKAYNEVRPGLLKAVVAEMLLPCTKAHAGMHKLAGAFLRLLQAWAQASVQPAYQEFADRWGSPEFTAYCQALQKTVDVCMSKVSREVRDKGSWAYLKHICLHSRLIAGGRGDKDSSWQSGSAGGCLLEHGL